MDVIAAGPEEGTEEIVSRCGKPGLVTSALVRAAFALSVGAGCGSRSAPPKPPPAELRAPEPRAVADPSAQTPAWLTDEAAAFARARREHKPVIIDFCATWSLPSQELVSVLAGPDVAPLLASGFIPLRFDVSNETDEDVTRKRRYGVETMPHLVVVDADGKVRGRLDHLADGPTVRALLEHSR